MKYLYDKKRLIYKQVLNTYVNRGGPRNLRRGEVITASEWSSAGVLTYTCVSSAYAWPVQS